MADMFAPLTAQEKIAVGPDQKPDSVAIIPVPHEAEIAPQKHPQLGVPHHVWDYLDADKRLLQKVCRFISAEGKKEDRPLSYRKFSDGTSRWAWKALDAPRPLYGLDRLAANPAAQVIVCEGEKAADAAQSIFSDMVAVTSPNGAGSPHKADWKVLAGRNVIIWPDNDEQGKNYAKSVAKLCLDAEVQSVRIVAVPVTYPHKWDLADDLPENADLQNMIDAAEIVCNPLEGIVERVKQDIGEAYKPEVLESLAELKERSLHEWMSLRQKLKRAGVGISALEQEVSKMTSAGISREPDHLELARGVIDLSGHGNLLTTVAHVWRWRDDVGVWRPIPDRELKQVVQRGLEVKGIEITRSLVDAVTDILKSEIFAPAHAWNPAHDIINVRNGELVWTGDAWQLNPHSREHHCTTQIPVTYDAQADALRFKQFLIEIFEGDADGVKKAQAILEMIGYSLCSHARHERFALLVGRGANGKSVILEVIRLLVGFDNASAVQPSQFSNRFQRAHLHLKLVNIVTEVAEGAEIADAELKAIVSGEGMTAEHKHMPPFDFSPFCTIWLGTNHMPHTRDFSEALFRRALVIPFNRVFRAGVDADPHLKDRLADELPGIMNLALQAYGDVLKRGAFTEPQSCLDAKREWRMQADQAAQFVAERCAFDKNADTESGILYREYEGWAIEAGITRKLSRQSLTQRLEKMGAVPDKGAKGRRMIYGIRLASWRNEVSQ